MKYSVFSLLAAVLQVKWERANSLGIFLWKIISPQRRESATQNYVQRRDNPTD